MSSAYLPMRLPLGARTPPLLAFLAALTAILVWAAPAQAHAELARSEPPANASLPTPPATVRLWFTEDIEPSFSEASVLDAEGRRVDDGLRPAPGDRRLMTLALRGLPPGTYTAVWRTLSAVDGHTARGTFAFGVGVAVAVAPPDPYAAQRPDPLGAAARWLNASGAITVAGGFPFLLWVWLPALRRLRPAAAQRDAVRAALRRLLAVTGAGLAVLIAGSCGILAVQAAAVAGGELGVAFHPATLWALVIGSRSGAVWLARLGLAGAAAGALVLAHRAAQRGGDPRGGLKLGAAAGAALLLTLSVNGHGGAAGRFPAINVLADWVHLVAAALWVGALPHLSAQALLLGALDRRSRAQTLAAAVPRFSSLALTALAVLAATGLYSSVLQMPDLQALTDTVYGAALGVKLLLLVPLAALGLVNLLVISGRLQRSARAGGERGAADPAPRFWALTTAEAAAGALVLMAAGVLTSAMPARQAVALPGMRPLEMTSDVAGLRLRLRVSPYAAGSNQFTVQATGRDGEPAEAERVALRFHMNDHEMGGQELVLVPDGPGRYAALGSALSMAGSWTAEVQVRRSGRDDAVAPFVFPIAEESPGRRAAAAAPDAAALSSGPLAAVELGALGALMALAAWRFGGASSKTGFAGLGLAGLFLLLAGYVGGSLQLEPEGALPGGLGVMETAALRNPFPPDTASLALGAPLFQQHCQACHGARARGDGPAAAGLNPRPVDLTLHANQHPDGTLYAWITNGVPGTAMPAFRSRLTDDERWHILNYVKSLAAAVDR